MNLSLRRFIAATAMLCPAVTHAQWTAVGSSTGISAAASSYQNITQDSTGNLYLSYFDTTNNKGSVMKYDGSTWSYLGGSAGITLGTAFYNSTAIAPNGDLYYSFQDGSNSVKLSVKKYSNNAWNSQWQNLSTGGAYFSSVKIAPSSGLPYVLMRDLGNTGNLSAIRYDGTGWTGVGTAGITSLLPYYGAFVIGKNDSMYVAAMTALGQVEVYKNHVTASTTTPWQSVGNTSSFTAQQSFSIFQQGSSIAIDTSDRLYLVYTSSTAEGNKLKVKKYENGIWSAVGADNFTAGAAKYVSIAVTPDGTPYVAYSDASIGNKTTVMKYDGTQWIIVGNAGISAGTAIFNSLTLDASGNPIVAFADQGNSGKTIVMHYTPPCNNVDPAATTGSLGCVTFNYAGSPVTYTTVRAADGNVWLQQNLGSANIAISSTDSNAYGDVYQWGRWQDGHEKRLAPTSAAPATNDPSGVPPGTNAFFTGTPAWWTGGALTDTWTAPNATSVSATNGCDPCKAIGAGWRLPTQTEWQTIITNESIISPATAYSSNLKLTTGGNRNSSGNYDFVGTRGYYWSSTTSSTGAKSLYYSSAITNASAGGLRAQGMSIRCLKMIVPVIDSVRVGVQNSATPSISTNAGTLQMTATVYPANMSQSVIWSIVPGSGTASVSSTGLVTAQSNGTVWAKAVSVQDTTKSDSMQVFISNQIIPVDSVVVTTQNNVQPVITTNAGLQLLATVYPAAANQNVMWSTVPITGGATVSASGLVSGTANGTVMVKAASAQDMTKQDSLIVTINIQATSINAVNAEQGVYVFPNPVKNVLNISLMNALPSETFTATVFNTNCVAVVSNIYNGNSAAINVANLPAGAYLLRITTNTQTLNKTFIKE
ncbi:T9SS type A sorting domain-containing protein [Taibaiella soli]|uniref:BIG2 domain-containing protein n=1 Tax=Taibaiella soli TaxID=1649169 RepID=A0A2W2BN79_9BACT|nr:T9SS type A sorting domain-containing protein [Taibaiella soli]PZF74926.1 hypothetical protein DN068_01640 [Taibaiella soli]